MGVSLPGPRHSFRSGHICKKCCYSVVKVRMIRFGGLPFVFASGEGWRTDAAKPG